MVNEKYYGYGTAPSIIRELFAYGLEQAKKIGKDKVYDYSLGNPSIPAPEKVNEITGRPFDKQRSLNAAKGLELNMMLTAKKKSFS